MRLIDADAFKDYIRNALEETKHMYKDNGEWAKEITESFCKDIDEQPTVDPEPKWIPVTERLPDVGADILFCDIDGDAYAGHRTRHGDFYPDFDGDKIKNVVAWMPKPEPYKEVTEWTKS